MKRDYPVPAGYFERDHPDARHICWAYQIGRPGSATEAAMNDDGEPSGTAGKPILNVIQHKDMGDVLVMVIRYFGGIKLGAGGLVRAYSGAAESVLSAVERVVQQSMTAAHVCLSFADEQPLRHWCEVHGGLVESVEYGASVRALVLVPEDLLAALGSFCDAQKLDYSFEK